LDSGCAGGDRLESNRESLRSCLQAQGSRSGKNVRQALNNLVNCKSGISPEMAVRLSKAFGGRPAVWLKMQMD